jgi:hypothetical protein
VAYSGRASRLRYSCGRAASDYAEPRCQGLAGGPLDDLVATQLLARLRTCPRGWSDEPVLAELTKPKARDNN